MPQDVKEVFLLSQLGLRQNASYEKVYLDLNDLLGFVAGAPQSVQDRIQNRIRIFPNANSKILISHESKK